MKTIAIIQARVGSTRLPGKVLMNLNGISVLEQVINRVKKAKNIEEVIVATSIQKENLPLVKICAENNIRVFVGSEDDVLDRYYQVAFLLKAQNIVRITADCPLIDPEIIDDVINLHYIQKADYTSNVNPPTFPDGLDVECFTFESLEFAWKNAKLLSEREHVTVYIRNNNFFSKHNLVHSSDLSNKRWTLDEKEDYVFISYVYSELGNVFGMKNVLELLENNSDIEKINNMFIRNEGYLKSIQKDNLK